MRVLRILASIILGGLLLLLLIVFVGALLVVADGGLGAREVIGFSFLISVTAPLSIAFLRLARVNHPVSQHVFKVDDRLVISMVLALVGTMGLFMNGWAGAFTPWLFALIAWGSVKSEEFHKFMEQENKNYSWWIKFYTEFYWVGFIFPALTFGYLFWKPEQVTSWQAVAGFSPVLWCVLIYLFKKYHTLGWLFALADIVALTFLAASISTVSLLIDPQAMENWLHQHGLTLFGASAATLLVSALTSRRFFKDKINNLYACIINRSIGYLDIEKNWFRYASKKMGAATAVAGIGAANGIVLSHTGDNQDFLFLAGVLYGCGLYFPGLLLAKWYWLIKNIQNLGTHITYTQPAAGQLATPRSDFRNL